MKSCENNSSGATGPSNFFTVKEQVYVFHNSIGFEFLATGLWDGTGYRGTLVVDPFINKAFFPEVLREMSQNRRVPLTMQKQVQQGHNTLPMVGGPNNRPLPIYSSTCGGLERYDRTASKSPCLPKTVQPRNSSTSWNRIGNWSREDIKWNKRY